MHPDDMVLEETTRGKVLRLISERTNEREKYHAEPLSQERIDWVIVIMNQIAQAGLYAVSKSKQSRMMDADKYYLREMLEAAQTIVEALEDYYTQMENKQT